jgi:hypothetical protein
VESPPFALSLTSSLSRSFLLIHCLLSSVLLAPPLSAPPPRHRCSCLFLAVVCRATLATMSSTIHQAYDDAIHTTAKQLKLTLMGLIGLAVIGILTGSILPSSISLIVLLVGYFGAHKRHTGMLYTVCHQFSCFSTLRSRSLSGLVLITSVVFHSLTHSHNSLSIVCQHQDCFLGYQLHRWYGCCLHPPLHGWKHWCFLRDPHHPTR